ncbi:MAG: chromate transporter [Clostridia bacterium]|nr:chromate transporter [Clostridia bacterium]
MNVALDLFLSFFKIGLFAVGGGPATLPYLMDLTRTRPWYTMEELANMVAISESTPGPIGLNMATYAGYQAMGPLGGFFATMGLVFPSVIIIIIVAKFLANFSKNPYVQAAFSGIRPAVTGLIAASVLSIIKVSLFTTDFKPIWGAIAVAAIVFPLLQVKKLKKLHPVVWFIAGAAIGVIFKL